VQFHAPIRIRVERREHLYADSGVNAELLANLPSQTGGMSLARFALSPRKFPEAFEVDAALTACQQKVVVVLDDRSRDDDRRHCLSGLNGKARQLFAIGQTRHFGFRATQTIAPKSINA
jgi:hypothetical protein